MRFGARTAEVGSVRLPSGVGEMGPRGRWDDAPFKFGRTVPQRDSPVPMLPVVPKLKQSGSSAGLTWRCNRSSESFNSKGERHEQLKTR